MILPFIWWFKAVRCEQGECLEVASLDDEVGIRDSKHADGPVLRVTRGEWDTFLAGAKAGDFDNLP